MGAIDGLVSGLNTTQIISQLMQVERLPEQQLTDHKTASQTHGQLDAGAELALHRAADRGQRVRAGLDHQAVRLGQHHGHLLGADAGQRDHRADGPAGQRPLHRHQRRQRRRPSSPPAPSAHSPARSPPARSPSPRVQRASGSRRSRPGATLSAGAHTITVTQASSAATLTGQQRPAAHGGPAVRRTRSPSPSTDGTASSTISSRSAQGSLHARRARRRDRPGSPGGALTARIDDGGHLQVSTAREGSAVSLTVDSGNTALGLAASPTPAVGQDGLVTLDGVAQPAVTSAGPGGTLTLTGANGDTVQATLSGGLRLGHRDHDLRQRRRHGHPQRRRAGHLRVRRRRQRHRGRGLEQRLPAAADVHHHRRRPPTSPSAGEGSTPAWAACRCSTPAATRCCTSAPARAPSTSPRRRTASPASCRASPSPR